MGLWAKRSEPVPQNSTFNVTANTLRLIQEKMVVAADICDAILDDNESWETLFQVQILPNSYKYSFTNICNFQRLK
jgi:poly(A) polymerase Pap1